MNKTKKTKIFIEAAIVIAVSLALIMPGSAVFTNNTDNFSEYNLVEVQGCLDKKPMANTFAGGDTLVTPFEGDDRLPSITMDLDDHVVISWTNEQSFIETYFGIGYSDDPTDPQTWYDNDLVLILGGNEMYFDTALIQGPEPDDYKGLMGVYLDMAEGQTGYYQIEDVTSDFAEWPIYFWTGECPEPFNAAISDGGFYSETNYPEIVGPFNFYIYHFEGMGYDIPQCPVFMHTDIRGGSGGVSYFDAQLNEQTAPADNPDVADVGTHYHTSIQNVAEDTIIWKKVVPLEDPDYEYTDYQTTVGSGTNPAIAAYGTNVAIVFASEGQVKCAYSSDDGETWNTAPVASGGFPDICVVGTTLFATYIDDGNLFKLSSTDGGENWGEAEQVNDVDGTVIDEAGSVDIHEAGIVWVDERGEDWDLYYDELVDIALPKIDIEQIAGGIGVSAVVTNNGDAIATNVDWSITLDGTVFLGGEASDTIASLGIGESEAIGSGFPLGFGDIGITITASCAEGKSDTETKSGKLLLFFIIGIE